MLFTGRVFPQVQIDSQRGRFPGFQLEAVPEEVEFLGACLYLQIFT